MRIHRSSPILWTKSLEETKCFYEEVLGFKARSNFPNFISLTLDDVELMFMVPQAEVENRKGLGNEEASFLTPTLTGSIFIYMDGVDALWETVKDHKNVKQSINDREYGMKDFVIEDNIGYKIVFEQDISGQNN